MKFGLRHLVSAVAGVGALAVPAHAGSLHWSGDVDDTATIYISGRDVRVDGNLKGVRNGRTDWRGELPRGGRIYLRDGSGRGRVRLLQQPSRENGYTTVIGIRDPNPGRGHYDFVLQWDDRGYGNGDPYHGRNGRRDRDDYRGQDSRRDHDRDDDYDRDGR